MIKKNNIKNEQGFSFAELMVVIAIVGILSAIALPSFLSSLPEKRLKNAARNLYVDLQKARLLAVKENKSVTFTFNEVTGKYSYLDGGNVIDVFLADYGAISYGCVTLNNWKGLPINGTFATDIEFKAVGTAAVGTAAAGTVGAQSDVYLQSQNNQDLCYAVTTSSLGIVRIRRFGGSVWDK